MVQAATCPKCLFCGEHVDRRDPPSPTIPLKWCPPHTLTISSGSVASLSWQEAGSDTHVDFIRMPSWTPRMESVGKYCNCCICCSHTVSLYTEQCGVGEGGRHSDNLPEHHLSFQQPSSILYSMHSEPHFLPKLYINFYVMSLRICVL